MLIAQSSSRARVAEPVHQFLGAGPRRRGQCPGDVPEIVKVNLLRNPTALRHGITSLPKRRSVEDHPHAGKEQRITIGRNPTREVRFDLGNNDSWKDNHSASRLRLRGTDKMVATSCFKALALYVDRAVEAVYVRDA